ncbi:hypothetical protein, partial [Candidatus Phytoplasma palmae]|uniref:hypothetical protein n=1 Tax=Candidatus Phytoplasma palmae TaxID=85624 RepID=UPI003990A178
WCAGLKIIIEKYKRLNSIAIEKIALDMVSFCNVLKNNPSLGYFYFKDSNISKIMSIHFAFCNCKMNGYSILELIKEVVNFKFTSVNDIEELRRHLFLYFSHLEELIKNSDKEETKEKVDVSIEELGREMMPNYE